MSIECPLKDVIRGLEARMDNFGPVYIPDKGFRYQSHGFCERCRREVEVSSGVDRDNAQFIVGSPIHVTQGQCPEGITVKEGFVKELINSA